MLRVGNVKSVCAAVMAIWIGGAVCGCQQPEAKTQPTVKETLAHTAEYLYETVTAPSYGSVGGEWTMIALKRSGFEVEKAYEESYLQTVEQVLEEHKGILDKRKMTEYDRVILSLTALGEDVTDVSGYNLLEKLCDFQALCVQGINGPIWTLTALDSAGYELPQKSGETETTTTREKLIAYILEEKLPEGGWCLSGNEADADMTAMAVQALSGYTDEREDVASAVEDAIEVLSELQTPEGGFVSWEEENLESTAQVLIALSAVGIDAGCDERFIKNDHSVYDALLSFQNDDGSFSHIREYDADLMASEQACCALAAYERFLEEKNALYDMTDVK